MFRIVCTALVFVCWLFPATAGAQGQPTFTAYADAGEVLLNSYFDVTFTLSNGDGQDFRPPSFKDFVVISGPSRSASTTIVNGQVAKELSYQYSLKPRRTGTFTIGPASVIVKDEVLTTQLLTIKVLEAQTGAGDARDQFFVRAEPIAGQAYIGQQISLDYKLYTTVDIESYNILEESDYPGFYAEDLKRFDGRVRREVYEGEQYTTKTLKRVALFPQQAGTLVIDPLQLQLGIVGEGQRRSNSFFFQRQIQRLLTQTAPVELRIMPLPDQRPATFTGAVGQFTMSSNLGRTTLTTDDVLSVKLTIRGNGDIKRVQAPVIEFPNAFEVYEPKILEEQTRERDGQLIGEKVIEYLALPKRAGAFTVRPRFSYFDPDSGSFVEQEEPAYEVTVRMGSRTTEAPPIAGVEPPDSETDIRYLKLDTRLERASRLFFGSPAFWGLTLSPFLLLGGLLGFRRYQEHQDSIDPAIRRRKQAQKIARQRLAQAEHYQRAGQTRPFYDEVSKALLGYVGDKLEIPRSSMTKEAVRDKLHTLGIPESLSSRFLAVLQTCESALYAGKDEAKTMDRTYQEAVEVLIITEQQIKAAAPAG